MYDTNFVRSLCADILKEPDPEKTSELIALLQAVIKEDQEEVRLRLAFLNSKYCAAISDAKAAD